MQHQDGDASTLDSKSNDGDLDEDAADVPRIVTAANELDSLCRAEFAHISNTGPPSATVGLPSKLLPIILLFPGNHCCVDCGNEKTSALKYGSVGYGTVLCEACANRHAIYTGEESNIQSLTNVKWSFRSILSLLSGSNSQMLEYIRSKPRWRPSKVMASEPDEVLAFKQIYLSKAAATYRSMVAQWVDQTYEEKMAQVQAETVAKKRLLEMQIVSTIDPIDIIFARNNTSREDIPGFEKSHRNSTLRDSFSTVKSGPGGNVRTGVIPPSFIPHETLPIDAIKHKISARRNRNPSIRAQAQRANAMAQDMLGGMDFVDHMEHQERHQAFVDDRVLRRRNSDIVGEVAPTEFSYSVRDQEYDGHVSVAGYGTKSNYRKYDDVTSVGLPGPTRGRGFDEQTLGSIPLMNGGARLGTYRRTSQDDGQY